MTRIFLAAALLALAACTQSHFRYFAVDSADPGYAGRAQFEDIKGYLLERGRPIAGEGPDFIKFRLAASDYLELRLMAGGKVELTLVRMSSASDFSAEQVKAFRETLEASLRERTGKAVAVRFVDEQASPRSNVRFQ